MDNNHIRNLLAPIKLENFSKEYWEKKYLVIQRNNEIYFDYILNEKDINEFLGRKDIYYPFIRLVYKGEPLPKSEYVDTIKDPGFNIVETDKVFKIYNSGGTIIIQKGHLSIKKLSAFCDQIESECNFSTNVNIYVTPKNTSGFNVHYDTHDIFILQIAGKKIWRLYDAPFSLPLNTQLISKEDSEKYSNKIPELEVELLPGDLIYIPRGFIHDTFTKETNSIHITLGIFPFTRIDIVKKILNGAETQENFRKFIPTIFSAPDEKEFFKENFKSLIKAYIDTYSIGELLESFEFNFLGEKYANNENRFISINSLVNVNLDTTVRVTNNLSYKFVVSNDNKVGIKFYDKEIKFPSNAEQSLLSITQLGKFKIKDIGGLLDDSSKLIIVKKLILEGFLIVVNYEI